MFLNVCCVDIDGRTNNMKLLTWVKEIKSKKGELHFKRFAIIQTSFFALYIHRIYKEDNDDHLHNHPWNFFSLILSGSYLEEKRVGRLSEFFVKKPFSFGHGKRVDYFHKIFVLISDPPVTSLFFTYGKSKPWGYLMEDGSVMENSEYREKKRLKQL